MNQFNRKHRTGFTLIEAAIAIGIVGILIAASTGTFGAIARSRKVEVERRQAFLLGQSLMNEILQTAFQEPNSTPVFGPEPGELRANYDDVDDFNGFSESVVQSRSGTTLSEYTGWSRSVVVAYVSASDPTTVAGSSTLKRITVTVVSPSNKTYTLVGLRSQLGAYEQAPSAQATYVTGVNIAVQGASPGKTIYSTAHPLNITTTQN